MFLYWLAIRNSLCNANSEFWQAFWRYPALPPSIELGWQWIVHSGTRVSEDHVIIESIWGLVYQSLFPPLQVCLDLRNLVHSTSLFWEIKHFICSSHGYDYHVKAQSSTGNSLEQLCCRYKLELQKSWSEEYLMNTVINTATCMFEPVPFKTVF